jgi:hypothetical protein
MGTLRTTLKQYSRRSSEQPEGSTPVVHLDCVGKPQSPDPEKNAEENGQGIKTVKQTWETDFLRPTTSYDICDDRTRKERGKEQ